MTIALYIFTIATLLFLIFTFIEFLIGFKKIKNLSQQTNVPNQKLPSISIIFSALNEEEDLEKALHSLMRLDYENYEVIAINDRSTDKTPAILEKLKKIYPRLRVKHIENLPKHWLGKNHALHVAAKDATGDWLLFTDADVSMKPETLTKAMSYTLNNKLDHLTIYERHHRNKFGLKILLLGDYLMVSILLKPWRIRYRWSKCSLGHGAFNLVKNSAYRQCGGHESIAMECLDDMKLGELLKRNGFQQDIADGQDLVEREWYKSLPDMMHGLKKNGFAFYDYKLWCAMRDMLLVFFAFVLPVLGLFYYSGTLFWLNTVNILIMFFISVHVAKKFHLPVYFAFFYPVAILVLIVTVANSILHTYKNNGIIWRDTYYPLKEIRASKKLVMKKP